MATPYGIIQLTIDGADIENDGIDIYAYGNNTIVASAEVVADRLGFVNAQLLVPANLDVSLSIFDIHNSINASRVHASNLNGSTVNFGSAPDDHTANSIGTLFVVPFEGTPGPAGPQGPQGQPGSQGIQGPVGPAGPRGATGPAGLNGANGSDGAMGPVGPTGPQGPVGATGPQGPQGPVGATGPQGATGLAAFAVSFDEDVTYRHGTAFLTGEVTPGATAVEIFENGTDLGAAKVNAQNGRWSFALTQAGSYGGLAAQATAADGNTASGASPYAITTQQPQAELGYAATQDNYDFVTGAYTGSDYIRANGSLEFTSSVVANPDGSTSTTFSGGNYFNDKDYYAFTDTYDADGTLVTHEQSDQDGSRTVDVTAANRSVASQDLDTFNAAGQPSTTFVFTPGYAQDVVNGFDVGGAGHDVLSLPQADFGSLADVLSHTRTLSGSAVITDPVSGDTLTLVDVTKAQLRQHPGDFTFHA